MDGRKSREKSNSGTKEDCEYCGVERREVLRGEIEEYKDQYSIQS